jgi:TorA maturation chaperone TorD
MMDSAAVFSVLSRCFVESEQAEWDELTAPTAWADFLGGARQMLQDTHDLAERAPRGSRRISGCPLRDVLSESELKALAVPPTFAAHDEFARTHFTGGLPYSAVPVESLYCKDDDRRDPLEPNRGLYLGKTADYMRDLTTSLGLSIPDKFRACPDHLSLELDLIAVLLRSGMAAQAQTLVVERLGWLTDYRMKLIGLNEEAANFYISLVDMLVCERAKFTEASDEEDERPRAVAKR